MRNEFECFIERWAPFAVAPPGGRFIRFKERDVVCFRFKIVVIFKNGILLLCINLLVAFSNKMFFGKVSLPETIGNA